MLSTNLHLPKEEVIRLMNQQREAEAANAAKAARMHFAFVIYDRQLANYFANRQWNSPEEIAQAAIDATNTFLAAVKDR